MSNRQGSPQPRTQALSPSSLPPNTKQHREGLLTPPIWSVEGSGTELWSASHTAGCRSGAPAMAPPPQVQPQATPSVSFPHKQGLSHDKRRWWSPAPGGRRAVSLLRGGETGFGAKEYIHVAKAGSWAFSVTPRLSPRNGSSGGQPLSRPKFRAHLTGWH